MSHEPPISTAGGRVCILVLGMHRCGTSALTRALSLLGAALPKQVLGALQGNQEGHWEPRQLIDLHDRMLAEGGSRWDDWRRFDPTVLGLERLAHYKAEIVRILADEYGGAPLFVVKDPRICRLMPLWREILREAGVQPRFAISLRNPIEAARSLAARDRTPLEEACLLWLRHVLEAERETRGLARVFLHYHELLQAPEAIASAAMSRLGVTAPAASSENKERIRSSVDSRLRHHFVEDAELDKPAPAFYPWLRATHEAHSALVRSPSDEDAQRALDHVRIAFDAVTDTFAPGVAAREAALREWHDTAVKLHDLLVARNAADKAIYERIAELEEALAPVRPSRPGQDEGPAKEREVMEKEFDAAFYAATYPDVAASGIDPLAHFLRHGWREGRRPRPDFDTHFYLVSNPDVAASGMNPFYHYLVWGRREGRPAR
jgi:hypothetical protein